MASLTIKGIPASLLEELRRSAERERRSLNSEVLHRLERSLEGTRPDAEVVLARIRAVRERIAAPPLTEELLRRAIDEGRP